MSCRFGFVAIMLWISDLKKLGNVHAVLHRQAQRLVRQSLHPGRVLVRPLRLQEELEGALEQGLGRTNGLAGVRGHLGSGGVFSREARVEDFWVL